MKIWVLTEEYNEYDQHGCYFICWWSKKPSKEQLKKVICVNDPYLQHVFDGGGRLNFEDQWYNLKEVEENE